MKIKMNMYVGKPCFLTIERFQNEYDESIHTGAGEQRDFLNEDSELVTEVKDLIGEYAGGNLNDESLQEQFIRVVAAYRRERLRGVKGYGDSTS